MARHLSLQERIIIENPSSDKVLGKSRKVTAN